MTSFLSLATIYFPPFIKAIINVTKCIVELHVYKAHGKKVSDLHAPILVMWCCEHHDSKKHVPYIMPIFYYVIMNLV